MQQRRAQKSRVQSPNYRPRYRRHRSGQARVTIDGRDFYLGPFGSRQSHEAYDRLIEEWLANGRSLSDAQAQAAADAPDAAEPITVLELLAEYWKMLYQDGLLPPDQPKHPKVLRFKSAIQPLRERFPAMLASEFGPRMLRTVRQQMIDDELCRITINTRINVIVRVFRWGASMELVPVNTYRALQTLEPIKRGQLPHLDGKRVQPVGEKKVLAVLPHVSPQVAAMVQLQWLTGMRPGEVVLMRADEIDRDGPTEGGVKLWLYRPSQHKTAHHGRSRVIPLGRRCQVILTPFLDAAGPRKFVFSPVASERERSKQRRESRKTPLWPSHVRAQERKRVESRRRPPGDRYDVHAYRRAIERGCRKAGVEIWSPNRLRHAAATRFRKSHGIDAARVLLGHVSASTTEIYARLDEEQAARLMAKEG